MAKKEQTKPVPVETMVRFKAETISFSEVRTLAGLVGTFITVSGLMEKVKDSPWYNGEPNSFLNLISFLPEAIYQNDESTKAFLHIVEFCTGIDVPDEQGVLTLQLMGQTLEFLKEVDILGFLHRATMILSSLIRG